jgi:hypothetical protein
MNILPVETGDHDGVTNERKDVTRETRGAYLKAGKKPKPKTRLDKPVYTPDTVACIEAVWRFYWYKNLSANRKEPIKEI